jgi:hypothetical protein
MGKDETDEICNGSKFFDLRFDCFIDAYRVENAKVGPTPDNCHGLADTHHGRNEERSMDAPYVFNDLFKFAMRIDWKIVLDHHGCWKRTAASNREDTLNETVSNNMNAKNKCEIMAKKATALNSKYRLQIQTLLP